jgi:hypothetical protein
MPFDIMDRRQGAEVHRLFFIAVWVSSGNRQNRPRALAPTTMDSSGDGPKGCIYASVPN